MNTALVGLVWASLGAIAKAIIDLSVKRYEKAQAVKEARDDLENDLRKQVFLWREHAYVVRLKAVKAGVALEDLPPLPEED